MNTKNLKKLGRLRMKLIEFGKMTGIDVMFVMVDNNQKKVYEYKNDHF